MADKTGPAKAKVKDSDYEIGSVSIERASNGFTVNKQFRLKKGVERDNMSYHYREPEQAVFNDLGNALEFVRDCLVKGKS